MPRIAVLMALTLAACAPRRPPATLHDIAEDYVRLTLQFAQHQPSLVDAWVGPESWRPGPRVPIADLQTALGELLARVERPGDLDPTERPRLDYLRAQLRALSIVGRRLSGESTDFERELEAMLGGRPGDPPDTSRERAVLEQELPGTEPLADRLAAFRRRFIVAEDRFDRVLAAAIHECRQATASHLRLPADERVEVRVEPLEAWSATAEYRGKHQTLVRVGRSGHDIADLLRMACHETYPGHHVQHVLIDDALVRGRGWREFELTPAFGPHLHISEIYAEAGATLAMQLDDQVRVLRESLLPLAGLPREEAERLVRIQMLSATFAPQVVGIVGQYLDNHITRDEAELALRDRALIPTPSRLLALAERHRAGAVVHATNWQVAPRLERLDEAGRWRKLQDIFTVTPFTLE